VLFVLGLIANTGTRVWGQSTSIPVANAADEVWDPTRGLLYITTIYGQVERYNPATNTLMSPWNVGEQLAGADITPDGSYLYAAEVTPDFADGVGYIRKVNLTNGAVTNIPYNLGFYEGGAWDIKIAGNGLAFFTTTFEGSGWTSLRQINLANDTVSVRKDDPGSDGGGDVTGSTGITRSPDGNELLFQEDDISSGPLFDYSAVTNHFGSQLNTNAFVGRNPAAINRNDTLVAFQQGSGISILNTSLQTVKTLSGPGSLTGGEIFDPVRDVLYVVENNGTSDQLLAFDTNTWAQLNSWSVGENISSGELLGPGNMAISSDGQYVFLATSTDVRMFVVPEPAGVLYFAFAATWMACGRCWRRRVIRAD